MKIEMISKAVICATSPLMYSGKPGTKFWEATTLQHDCSSPLFYHILSFVTIPYQILVTKFYMVQKPSKYLFLLLLLLKPSKYIGK